MGVFFSSCCRMSGSKDDKTRDQLAAEVDQIQKKIDAVSKKIDAAHTQRNKLQEKFDTLLAKVKEDSAKIKTGLANKEKLYDEQKRLFRHSSTNFEAIRDLSKQFPVPWKFGTTTEDYIKANTRELNKELKNLEGQILQISSLSQEKKLVQRVNQVKKMQGLLVSYADMRTQHEEDNKLQDSIKAEIDKLGAELEKCFARKKDLSTKLNTCRAEKDKVQDSLTALNAERSALYDEKNKKRDKLQEKWDAWKEQISEKKALKLAKEDKIPPYDSTIKACDYLIKYLSNRRKQETAKQKQKQKALAKTEKVAEETNSGDTEAVESGDEKESELDTKEKEEPFVPVSVPVTHSFDAHVQFELASMLPPTESSQFSDTIEALKKQKQQLASLNTDIMNRRSVDKPETKTETGVESAALEIAEEPESVENEVCEPDEKTKPESSEPKADSVDSKEEKKPAVKTNEESIEDEAARAAEAMAESVMAEFDED